MKIAIVGAGVMGQLTALNLLKAGHELTLFEKNSKASRNNCSMAAAGMLSRLAELEKSSLAVYELAKDSLQNHWPYILQQFEKPIYFSKKGSLLVSHPQDRAELDRFVKLISAKLDNMQAIQKLSKRELSDREPELAKFDEAYYFAQEAQLDNQALIQALEERLTQLKLNWRYNTEVQQLKPHQVICEKTTENFDWVVDCRGLAAKDQFVDLRGIRGELIWLKAPEVKIKHLVRLLHPRYSLYLVPRPENIYLLGASEIESEDSSEISVRTALELLSAAYYLHPGFAEARLIKTVTHCRPTLRDHEPKIKIAPGFIAANGLYRHGFLLAPSLAQEISNCIDRGFSSVKYRHFWEELC